MHLSHWANPDTMKVARSAIIWSTPEFLSLTCTVSFYSKNRWSALLSSSWTDQ